MKAKLTDKQVKDMRILRATDPDHWGYAALGNHFGCSESTARDVVLYKTRADVIVDVPPEEVKPDRFDLAAELRQKILDYINANGTTSSKQVARHFKITHDAAYRATQKMYRLKELSKTGDRMTTVFNAIKTESASASELRDAAYNKRSYNMMEKRPQIQKNTRPGHYIHHPDMPIKNQGGQGNLRRVVGIQASAGML